MTTRSVPQLAIICSTALAALIVMAVFMHNQGPKAAVWLSVIGVMGACTVVAVAGRYRQAGAKARPELSEGHTEQFLRLAEEYRRLSDLAITAQEHADLKLSDVSAQLDHLRGQVESLQRILSEVE
jgi:acetyl-CoA carboxylase carboxyltransferase component